MVQAMTSGNALSCEVIGQILCHFLDPENKLVVLFPTHYRHVIHESAIKTATNVLLLNYYSREYANGVPYLYGREKTIYKIRAVDANINHPSTHSHLQENQT